MNLLESLIIILIIGLVAVSVSKKNYQKIGLLFTGLGFINSILLLINYDVIEGQYQYITKIEKLGEKWVLGVDGLSIWLIMLTCLLIPTCLLGNWISLKYWTKEYVQAFIIIELMLIIVFSVLDVFLFYIFFEAVLIPMFYIIGIWGSREQKIVASYYFFLYTLIGSVLMLIGIMYIDSQYGTTNIILLNNIGIEKDVQNWLWLAFFASLAVKIPMYPFHLWLPQAHVEAPLGGSVLLAGVLLKLGGYGFIRYVLPLFPDANETYGPIGLTLSIIGIIYGSLITLRQIDLKRLIAYSSVAHMAVVTLGIFSNNNHGINGAIFLMLAHGFVSSALFIVVTILYDRFHTRIVKYYRGITTTMPIYSTIFFILTLANIATPLTCNFIGEFVILTGTFNYSPLLAILGGTGMILSAAYSLFLYNRVAFGTISPYIVSSSSNRDITRREFMVLFPLMICTIFFGIYPELIFSTLI